MSVSEGSVCLFQVHPHKGFPIVNKKVKNTQASYYTITRRLCDLRCKRKREGEIACYSKEWNPIKFNRDSQVVAIAVLCLNLEFLTHSLAVFL